MQVSDDFIFWLKILNALTIFWLIYISDIIEYKTCIHVMPEKERRNSLGEGLTVSL